MKRSKSSRQIELFTAPPNGQLGWIYCADNKRMPAPLTPVIALTKSSNSEHYVPVNGVYWKTSLDSFNINYDREPVWYTWENKLQVQVMAWLYIAPAFAISQKELEAFIKHGAIVYGAPNYVKL